MLRRVAIVGAVAPLLFNAAAQFTELLSLAGWGCERHDLRSCPPCWCLLWSRWPASCPKSWQRSSAPLGGNRCTLLFHVSGGSWGVHKASWQPWVCLRTRPALFSRMEPGGATRVLHGLPVLGHRAEILRVARSIRASP